MPSANSRAAAGSGQEEGFRGRPAGALAGLDSSYKRAHARVDQMLEPEDRHFLDVRSQADVIQIVGHAAFLDPLLALEAKVLRQCRRGAAKVETKMRRSA